MKNPLYNIDNNEKSLNNLYKKEEVKDDCTKYICNIIQIHRTKKLTNKPDKKLLNTNKENQI